MRLSLRTLASQSSVWAFGLGAKLAVAAIAETLCLLNRGPPAAALARLQSLLELSLERLGRYVPWRIEVPENLRSRSPRGGRNRIDVSSWMLPVGVRVAVRLVEGDNTIPLPVYQVHADSIAPLRSRRRPPSRRRGSQTWPSVARRGWESRQEALPACPQRIVRCGSTSIFRFAL